MRYPDPDPEQGVPLEDALPAAPARPERPPAPRVPLRTRLGTLLMVVLVAAIAVFGLQNLEPVRVEFLGFAGRFGVAWVIATATVVGFAIGWLVGRPSRAQRRRLRDG